MKYAKLLFSLLIVVLLVVSISGCQQTSEDTAEQISKNTEATTTATTTTPKEWIALDKDYTFDSRIYIPVELDKTTKLTITLNLPSGKSLEYIGIIPESELETWKQDDTATEFKYLKTNVESGTYTTTLNAGKYFFVIGLPTPQPQTLKDDTIVVKAGDYEAIPIYLDNIIYAQNMQVTINIRENLDISLYLLEQKEYQILKQGGTPKAYLVEKKATSGTYTIYGVLLPDTYYLVLSNTYSILTDKTIDYTVTAEVSEPFTGHIKIIAKEES